jgi:Na+/melibiose symporter-like transporter
LTRDPHARNRLFSVRGSMIYIGAITFYVLPLLPIFETTEFTTQTLKYTAALSAVLMLPALYVALRHVPNGAFVPGGHGFGLATLLAVLRNRPFAAFATIYLLTGLAGGAWLSLTFVVLDRYYGLGESIALMYFLGSFVGICGLPFWLWLAGRIGKRRSWIVAQLMNVACFCVPLFVAAGPSAKIPLLVATVGIFFSEGCRQTVLPSLLADIVDYGTLKHGADRAATYFSINTLLQKVGIGIGAALGLASLGLLGFDPKTVTVGAIEARQAVIISFCFVPALIVGCSLLLLWRFKLDARHASIVRRRLDSLARRSVIGQAA